MSAKVPLGELLRIAPSVRRGVTNLLDGYERPRGGPTSNLCCVESPPKETSFQGIQVKEGEVKVNFNAAYAEGIPGGLTKSPTPKQGTPGIDVLKANIRLGGSVVTAIVDTGASHCMLSAKLAKQLGIIQHMKPCTKTFRSANGGRHRPLGILYTKTSPWVTLSFLPTCLSPLPAITLSC